MAEQLALVKVVDAIEMGVLEDGTPFLTGGSLSRLCGVAKSTVIERKDEWAAGDRGGKLMRLLVERGYDEPQLCVPIKLTGGSGVAADALAYPEEVVMTFLEYYAFEVRKPEALDAYRKLGRGGFKLFVYAALGYDPRNLVPQQWRQFHDRMNIHATPYGYFSVFKESADFILLTIQRGLQVDHQTVPDISVGKLWGQKWIDDNLEAKYGPRKKHDHNYPDYFPQAESNPQSMWVYPIDALPDYRRWLATVYVPTKFPAYIQGKVAKGVLPASTAELVKEALQAAGPPPALPVGGSNEKP
jgi:hypothetical protein